MIVLALLAGCKSGPMDPATVREHLDAPTARLTSGSIPDLTDDWFASRETWMGENMTFGWLDIFRGDSSLEPTASARRVPRVSAVKRALEDLRTVENPLLGEVICASSFLLSLASYEDCSRGDTCEVELVVDSCLLSIAGDEAAKGKIRLTIAEQQADDFDRGSFSIGFEKWRWTLPDGAWGQLDGLVAIEGTSYHDGSREELLYTADFASKGFDPLERGLFKSGKEWDRSVRAAMRLLYEDVGGSQSGTVEVLAWVDEDGDGRPDASAVLRFSATTTALDDGALAGFTMEVIDGNGTWTCTWEAAEEASDRSSTTWSSRGSCTDPGGQVVDFDGSVEG